MTPLFILLCADPDDRDQHRELAARGLHPVTVRQSPGLRGRVILGIWATPRAREHQSFTEALQHLVPATLGSSLDRWDISCVVAPRDATAGV